MNMTETINALSNVNVTQYVNQVAERMPEADLSLKLFSSNLFMNYAASTSLVAKSLHTLTAYSLFDGMIALTAFGVFSTGTKTPVLEGLPVRIKQCLEHSDDIPNCLENSTPKNTEALAQEWSEIQNFTKRHMTDTALPSLASFFTGKILAKPLTNLLVTTKNAVSWRDVRNLSIMPLTVATATAGVVLALFANTLRHRSI
ncbi:MAG: hypothetical protein K2Y01_02880 [Rhabdochlamydiaceae bacterium]|nr:hypothetical protein [Rhabdochlamydiaceae bacterium]